MNLSALANYCRSKRKFALGIIALGALFFLAATQMWLVSASSHKTRVITAAARSAPVVHAIDPRIEGEVITIRETGFEPAQITRPPGPFIMLVQNRSGLETVRLQLYLALLDGTPTGPALWDVVVPREQLDWSDLQALPPGNYVLTEADHADWRVTMINILESPINP